MNTVSSADVQIQSPWIEENVVVQQDKNVLISVVAYQHPMGMPARFCAGLIPAVDLAKQLQSMGITAIIRLIDPTTIANHCNDWKAHDSGFREIINEFLDAYNVDFFFDESEHVSDPMLEVLVTLGRELATATDPTVADMVQRISESGRKHGGEVGAVNALAYMAAHPFSWLDMYHPLIWKNTYYSADYDCINLMSKAEARFTLIRRFLQQVRPDLSTTLNPSDRYMTVCSTPCYIPLEGEPVITDVSVQGHDWCYNHYRDIRKTSSNHGRAFKDFAALMSFLELRCD